MSPAHVFEPTYRAIRGQLLAGAWPMGYRLEAGRLADDLGVSITPVRDSLNRLVGERLVALIPGIGFHVPLMTEQRLRDLLDLHLAVLLHVLKKSPAIDTAVKPAVPARGIAEQSAILFETFAARSGNREAVAVVEHIGACLHATRSREAEVLGDAPDQLDALHHALTGPVNQDELIVFLQDYHTTRDRQAAQLVAFLQPGSRA